MTRARSLIAALLVPGALAGQSGKAPPADPRAAAASDTATRIVISLARRKLWVIAGASDTLLAAPVAVGSGKTLRTGSQSWTFRTPRGVRVVLEKETDPVWVRPDWAYVEVARKHKLGLEYLSPTKPRMLADGTALVVRDRVAGILDGGEFAALSFDDELVFDGVLFVPPIDSRNRRVAGQLGRYRLNFGDGIGLHGTPDAQSIGRAVTHGCLRLADDDLEWVYFNVGVGAKVYIY